MNDMTVEELILKTSAELLACGIESARFEAKQLVSAVTNGKFSFEAVTTEEIRHLDQMLDRRKAHEPLQYILGEWEFYGFPFKVGSGVLIPRQDTETLIEAALPLIKKGDKVFDLCAGSGCIGITLAKLKGADVTLFEKSREALEYIKQNITLNAVNVSVSEYDVLGKPFDGKADVIVSNPPYIKTAVVNELSAEVKHEPKMALDGGSDGLIFYRHIASVWKESLNGGGWLIFEIGFDQGDEVSEILENAGYKEVRCIKDLGQNDRVVIGRK